MDDSSIDKLYEMFGTMFEQQQQLRSIHEVLKHTLEPNPVKLLGPENYISWARHAQLILSSHGYEGLLVADDEEMKGSGTSNKQINDRVLVWLFGSMEPIVRDQVETMATIAGVWSSLERQFSGKSNKMQANRIIHELSKLKQGSRSVIEYAGEMRKLYRELHYYHPFEPVDKRDVAVYHTWFEPIVSKLFLDGLNEEFDLRRQLVFSSTEWPSLDDIVSSVVEEETRLAYPKVENQESVDAGAALSMQACHSSNSHREGNKPNLFCDYCKYKGHSKEMCYKLNGYPASWQKRRPRPGGVQSSSSKLNQANNITTAGEVPVVNLQALEEFKSKLKLSESSATSIVSSKIDTGFHATTKGARYRETSWDRDRA